MGKRAGVSDLFLPYPNSDKHGLFIEMKSIKGKVSENQKLFIDEANSNGYKAVVCYSFEEAKKAIDIYLEEVV